MDKKVAGAGKKKKEKKQRSWLARNLLNIILTIVLVVGLGLLSYPTIASWWNSTRQSGAVKQYVAELEEVDTEAIDAAIESAKNYNSKIVNTGGIGWKFNEEDQKAYDAELNLSGVGVMGYIEINSLDVTLPIYHGTDEAVLQQGVGHLESTSLPVGAKSWDDDKGMVTDSADGSHCVVSGHRGLPSSRLFTDLDKMKEGDTFALNIYNNLLIYEVDQIRVVLPEDLSNLKLEKGQDYCTLVTCTPYGINSHRLLVRGRRVSTLDAERYIYRIQGNATQIRPLIVALLMAAPILAILFLSVVLNPKRLMRKRKKAS
ncbi:MAG: class C sortase [Firmicutes bacterium]|nr:class C sortase [Bacillota bacterium]